MEKGGDDHVTVGVEIERSASTEHPNQAKEVQKLSYELKDYTFEKTIFTFDNVDDGRFILKLSNPNNLDAKHITEASSMKISAG